MEKRKTFKFDSIDAYNKLYGLKTFHPLVSVVDLKESTKIVNHITFDYGVYALFLKNGTQCTLHYGREKYDYQEGTIVTFAPGQIIEVDSEEDIISPDVIALIFHPDLIYGTPLGENIHKYSFFNYSQREALHLSEDERALFLECLDKIKRETIHPIDRHSADLIAANIQLLLEYLYRFYDRQFITRHKVNNDVVRSFEKELSNYFSSGKSVDGLPSVAFFAEKANLSPGYFGDLIKKELGQSAKDIISAHVIARAKQRLASTNDDIAIIAYEMGYQYPQHFTRQFKRLTGMSPKEFRLSLS